MRKLRFVDETVPTVKNAEDPIVPPPPPKIHERYPNTALVIAGGVGVVVDQILRMLF